jgi:predicted AlkP superfamily pyrophosphatase or phosphodiesterase
VSARKLVLVVVDALSPAALAQAVADGAAPTLQALMERGDHTGECVSTFPSLTPVAASAITTGLGPDEHLIPSINWYHRGEERYVEYGSSFPASRAFGVLRSLQDTVYNMNFAHLTQDRPTVFESLDDAGVRTACTTYLIYRGRHRHEPSVESRYRRLAEAAQFRHAVWGPRELFYADLFDSRPTGCSSLLGLPGQRDRHAGCVGAHLVEHDLFDFLLLSLIDNDTYSHRQGPAAQPTSIALADRALERVMAAAGGVDGFLDEHAVIIMSDHSQSAVASTLNLTEHLPDRRLLLPSDPSSDEAELAVCPGGRSAMVYVLDPDRRERLAPELARELAAVEGVDFTVRRAGGEAAVASERGELRFAPGGELRDLRGERWSVEGELAVLDLQLRDDRIGSASHPHALARLWSALGCRRAGDVLLSADPGYEFVDWGGAHHTGGGSHGSLHACDSHGVLLTCGVGSGLGGRPSWHLCDVTPMVLDHFGLTS